MKSLKDDIVWKDSLYTNEILGGIVDAIQLCITWSTDHPDGFLIFNGENKQDWQIQKGSEKCEDVVGYVNRNLYEKYKDSSFTARVWEAMYYEVPEKIFLNDACGSHAVIFKRTASQQRICLAVFVVMQFIQYGRFTVKSRPEGEPEHMAPPSLQILQRLQCDHENVFLKEYIVEISNDTSFMTNDQFCLLPCAAVFLTYNIQPLAEVILPFSHEDERKMISSRKLTPYWKTKHIAVMKMIDAHFQDLPYTRYYTTERGPDVLQEIFGDVMLEAHCELAMTVPMECSDDVHHFWCRTLMCSCKDDTCSNDA